MDVRLKEVVVIVARIGAGRSGVSNPARWNKLFSTPKRPDRLWASPSLQFNGYWDFFKGEKRPGREVNHDLHLVPRLRKSGVICLLLLYAFMMRTGTILFSTFVVWWLILLLLALWRELDFTQQNDSAEREWIAMLVCRWSHEMELKPDKCGSIQGLFVVILQTNGGCFSLSITDTCRYVQGLGMVPIGYTIDCSRPE